MQAIQISAQSTGSSASVEQTSQRLCRPGIGGQERLDGEFR
jgi:hypothetical protein